MLSQGGRGLIEAVAPWFSILARERASERARERASKGEERLSAHALCRGRFGRFSACARSKRVMHRNCSCASSLHCTEQACGARSSDAAITSVAPVAESWPTLLANPAHHAKPRGPARSSRPAAHATS